MLGKKKPVPAKKPAAKPAAPVAAQKPATQEKPPVEEESHVNFIAPGTTIEGNIISSDELNVAGTVRGDIRTSSKLILGPKSVVEGNVTAKDAEVAGQITGTAECTGSLTIRSTCVIEGDIVTKSLNVESGSSFNGRCRVGEAAKKQAASSESIESRMATSALDD